MIGVMTIGREGASGISSDLKMASIFHFVDNAADTGLAIGLEQASTQIEREIDQNVGPAIEFLPQCMEPFSRN